MCISNKVLHILVSKSKLTHSLTDQFDSQEEMIGFDINWNSGEKCVSEHCSSFLLCSTVDSIWQYGSVVMSKCTRHNFGQILMLNLLFTSLNPTVPSWCWLVQTETNWIVWLKSGRNHWVFYHTFSQREGSCFCCGRQSKGLFCGIPAGWCWERLQQVVAYRRCTNEWKENACQ